MRTTAFLIAVLLVVSGCGDNTASSGNAEAKPSEPSALVEVTAVREAPVSSLLTAYGSVEYSPEGARFISVDAEQVVTGLQVAVGQEVRKGEALLTVEASSAVRLQLEQAKVGVSFARAEVERLTELRTRGLATNAEVQAAEKNLASVKAQLSSLETRSWGGGPHVIRAPAAGVVQAVDVALGQIVAPSAPLLSIGDALRTRVRLGIEQDDLARLQPGQHVQVQALNSQRAPIVTSLSKIFRHVDAKTRLADAVVALPPKHGLLPGALVRAQIVVETHPHALVVPRPAVLFHDKKAYVFVDSQSRARERDITIGIEEGPLMEVLQGLAAGDEVISSGNAQLNDGMAVRTQPKK
ncbi:MAG: efflux RND transporter periplasmic adaptor subunit [Pseudomonadota bacterium]|nr:efflux RND transporter periplasmic adaptor subunit [Pseudomonadota bacterium]